MHIGEVAEATGLTQRTIRYYEELGLLPAPGRTQGDFRLYSPQDVHRLTEITRLKDLLGFSLAEIKEIVLADEQERLSRLRECERLTLSQLSILDRKLAQMAEMKSDLETRLARYRNRIAELDGREVEGAQP